MPASRRQMGPRASVSLPSCRPSSPAEASCCPHLCQPALAPYSPPSLPQKCSPSLPILQPSGNTLLQEAFLTALSTGLPPALSCCRASPEPMARPGCPSLCVIPQATLGLSPSICKVGEALTMEPEGRMGQWVGHWGAGIQVHLHHGPVGIVGKSLPISKPHIPQQSLETCVFRKGGLMAHIPGGAAGNPTPVSLVWSVGLLGLPNRVPQTGGLNHRSKSATVLEARRSRSGCPGAGSF